MIFSIPKTVIVNNKFKCGDKVIYLKSYQEMTVEEIVEDPVFTGVYVCSWIDPIAGEKITMIFDEKHLVLSSDL